MTATAVENERVRLTTLAGWRRLASDHRWFAIVFLLAFILRLAAVIAYRPLLMQLSDTWGYLSLSFHMNITNHFVVAPERPFGYPLVLWLIARPFGFHATLVTGLQHLAGLATGTLAYVALVRFGVRRWLAVVAAGVILLDTYMVALEQTILPEPFFILMLMLAAYLVAVPRKATWHLPVAGLLLGAATTLRFAGLIAVVPWLVYLVWRHWRRPALVLLAALGFAFPVFAYASAHAGATGRFGLSDASGWFLYGRVAYIADCNKMHVPPGTRFLCQPKSQRVDDPGVYIWNTQLSPARHRFPGWGATPQLQHQQDQLVGSFARAAIRARPFAYLGLVGRDFLRFFEPGIQPWGYEAELFFPSSVNPDPGPLGTSVWPGFRNEARWPAPVLKKLSAVFRTPRWLLAATTLIAILNLIFVVVRALRRRVTGFPRAAPTLLFVGIPLSTLVAAAATAQFGLRYMVSVAPLFVVGGALAVDDALVEWRVGEALAARAGGLRLGRRGPARLS
jgi:hypothetical protein